MSAYLVSKDTMRACVTRILQNNQTDSIWKVKYANDPEKIGAALFAMNARAVRQRYGDKSRAPRYTHRSVTLSPVSAFKQLACLLYQCSEGTVPKSLLYRALEDAKRDLAVEIVYELPEWHTAPWGLTLG